MTQTAENHAACDQLLNIAIRGILSELDRVKSIDPTAKVDLQRVADEATVFYREATSFLSRRLRRRVGVRGLELGKDLAGDWAVEVFEDGLPNYNRARPFRPFMNIALWRAFLKHSRRDQCGFRHLPALHHAATGVVHSVKDDRIDPFVREEISAAIQFALFDMNARDRALLDLYSSTMRTVDIAALLNISVDRWAMMAFRARERFVKQLRMTCNELGLPTATFAILRLPTSVPSSKRGRKAA